eukprot:TRINITY_DN735_c0_g1_i1.p1 TRINITY_DN735_c0_g1~~TRINITY_DN735_c0_g1_i1.p1  ORF type:complete len:57 (+),score=1.10 TRINITY_DN735_c0_g1_i1:357-527(+)
MDDLYRFFGFTIGVLSLYAITFEPIKLENNSIIQAIVIPCLYFGLSGSNTFLGNKK